ncbi:hypothetical protein ACD591_14285 [Rufibacter glacialis]|uniref:STAS/SEC14 domain-containing protein n=1 Tax=Rufibacter glacialis TaxID=1259555 RepID=A0A5M8Q579_9BACT|nr:hypothetical protein [Rufibacter glacialis]KAA6430989.1 hypothetical protein FOE74_17945 [Rufibacter glacialis]GGK83100.1 hypothetical protein GCM10011405_33660 [Rufibacter glacialis]
MRIAYFKSSGLTLSYDHQHTAYAVWNGFLSSQVFRESALKCLELLEEKGIERWLADNRKMKAIRQADQHWFVENIMPRILQSNLRRMATLVSDDLFNKMAVEQMLKRAGHPDHLLLRDFQDEAEAVSWLMVSSPGQVMAQE